MFHKLLYTYIDFIDFLYMNSAAIGEATQGPKEVAPIVKEGYLFKRGELSLVMYFTFHRGRGSIGI